MATSVLVFLVSSGGAHAWLDRWAPAAEWAVATGTIVLAIGTFALAKSARHEVEQGRSEAQQIKRQVQIEADQLVAAQRPLVVPTQQTEISGIPHLVVENVGSGPALNARGTLYWLEGTEGDGRIAALHQQMLAAGERVVARVLNTTTDDDIDWSSAQGFLKYHDLSGAEWQTHFRFHVDGVGNVSVAIAMAGTTDDLGDPAYNHTRGWLNRPEGVKLWTD